MEESAEEREEIRAQQQPQKNTTEGSKDHEKTYRAQTAKVLFSATIKKKRGGRVSRTRA